MHGFMAMLMKIEYTDGALYIAYAEEESRYIIKNRMIHICVFPENDLYFIKKLIRLSALCQYTHIVIEFWGMLKYDCLDELSWSHAFTKDEARELITECRDLGIEPVPMFNQLGHATASRLCYGKHVVLDRNPSLQHLFTPDGWAWDIESEEVWLLLKKVRAELYEVFGEGLLDANGKPYKFSVNDIYGPCVVTFVGSIAGIVLAILFSRYAIVSLVTLVVGCSAARWYLICPAMQVGQNWQIHLACAMIAAITAGLVILSNVVIPYIHKFVVPYIRHMMANRKAK
jgi:hypothetical protein